MGLLLRRARLYCDKAVTKGVDYAWFLFNASCRSLALLQQRSKALHPKGIFELPNLKGMNPASVRS